ncbi:P-loop containing nucleoside triphosphate hydrolase [Pseudocohnilembus persalinus]|uniref:Signal recognition particle receptor subunit beta n=1 Tax=Pseudocohnilembus persalinus TaxID=266149 RepID=A0A0V0QNM4_PSEPJ|nr:P-loop containing nucleoside triphosphate hydrolase [Pseudocohnilembus persalinus]|eukprot:KRX03919.1 P-loop containing nucleoside triphosphate hydrolase [Pseudocohnilembus persalinus]
MEQQKQDILEKQDIAQDQSLLTYGAIGVAILIGFILIFKIFMSGKSKKPGKNLQKGKTIYLMGECGAGKTALLYKLAGHSDIINTVSSIDINETIVSVDNSNVPIIDIPGHNYTKTHYLKELKYARVIIIVVDATNQESFANCASYLYNILIQKEYQDRQIPILLALNKSDAPKALKLADFEHLFNKEMERVKKSKKAINDESEDIDDYIKHQDQMFSISANGIDLIQCSVLNDDIDGVQKFLQNKY